jgi:hypothetical protein
VREPRVGRVVGGPKFGGSLVEVWWKFGGSLVEVWMFGSEIVDELNFVFTLLLGHPPEWPGRLLSSFLVWIGSRSQFQIGSKLVQPHGDLRRGRFPLQRGKAFVNSDLNIITLSTL